MSENKGTVVCTAAHPTDLDDGRSLAPGESADNIDIDKNQDAVDAGHLTVVGKKQAAHGNTPNNSHSTDGSN